MEVLTDITKTFKLGRNSINNFTFLVFLKLYCFQFFYKKYCLVYYYEFALFVYVLIFKYKTLKMMLTQITCTRNILTLGGSYVTKPEGLNYLTRYSNV